MEDLLTRPVKLFAEHPEQFQYEQVGEEARGIMRQIGVRNLLIEKKLQEVICAFNHAGIDIIILKGSHLTSEIYPFGVRFAEDIDLLVPPKDADLADSVLIGMGYQDCAYGMPVWVHRDMSGKITYIDGCVPEIPLDLHFNLGPYPYLGRLPFETLTEHSEPFCNDKFNAKVLKPEMLMIHLCLHFIQHMAEGRSVSGYDIMAVIRHYRDQIDWNLFCRLSEDYKLTLPVSYSLKRVMESKPALIPEFVLTQLDQIHNSYLEKRYFTMHIKQSNPFERHLIQLFLTPGIILKLRCVFWIVKVDKKFLNAYYSGSYRKYLINSLKTGIAFVKAMLQNRS